MSFVRAYVGVTDQSWYRFLAGWPQVTEVNFWQPSGVREFRALAASPGTDQDRYSVTPGSRPTG